MCLPLCFSQPMSSCLDDSDFLSIHLVSLSSPLFFSPLFSMLLVHFVFCLQSLRCLIMVSHYVQACCNARATHYTSLLYLEVHNSSGLILLFTNDGCRNHCSLHSTHCYTSTLAVRLKQFQNKPFDLYVVYPLHNVQTIITLYCSVSPSP